jgi:hypothetical protein
MIAGVSGFLLFIFLFLPWVGAEGVDESLSGWEANNPFDIVLLITAIVAIGAALGGGVELPGISINGATAVLGIVSAIAILWFLIDYPEGLERKIGIFLSLLAAVGVAYGGFTAAQEEGQAY